MVKGGCGMVFGAEDICLTEWIRWSWSRFKGVVIGVGNGLGN